MRIIVGVVSVLALVPACGGDSSANDDATAEDVAERADEGIGADDGADSDADEHMDGNVDDDADAEDSDEDGGATCTEGWFDPSSRLCWQDPPAESNQN